MWQTLATYGLIALAAMYLLWTLRPRKARAQGCGTCACPSASPTNSTTTFVPADQLTLRR